MILCYHKIGPVENSIWCVSVDAFSRQMSALRRRKVVHLDDYDGADPDHVVITFDGVDDSVFQFALPILEHFGYPFELFVMGDCVGRDSAVDRAVEPPRRFADVRALESMSARGGRVQWRGRTQGRFSDLDAAGQRLELAVTDDLAARFDAPHLRWFAYPHGADGDHGGAMLRERLVGALARDGGDATDRHVLPRRLVSERHDVFQGRVSAIVANDNHGRLLADAVASLERQSVPPDEILIIDDASTDESPAVLDGLAARGHRVERNAEHRGIVESLRKAVSLTTGDYVFVLGADNRLRHDFILECRAALDRDPGAAVAYTDMLLWGAQAGQLARDVGAVKTGRSEAENRDLYHWRMPDPTPDVLSRFATHNFVHGSSMYRRTFYDRLGGYSGSAGAADHDLFYRMWSAGGGLVHVPLPLLEYRRHGAAQVNIVLGLQAENQGLRERTAALVNECEAVRNNLRELDAEHSLTHNLTDATRELLSRLTAAEGGAAQEAERQRIELEAVISAQKADLIRLREALAAEQVSHRQARSVHDGERAAQADELDRLRTALRALAAEQAGRKEHLLQLEHRPAAAERKMTSMSAALRLLRRRQGQPIEARPEAIDAALIADARAIFDPAWYAEREPVPKDATSAWRHFLEHGLAEGRDPSPLFDGGWYLETYPEVAAAGMAAFVHYLAYGAHEGRSPHPLFDAGWYLGHSPDVAAARVNPLAHFVASGALEGREPHPLFSARWYRQTYQDIAEAVRNPLQDYLVSGAREGRDPNPLFDGAWYLRAYPEVARADLNPLVDYVVAGAKAGREPNSVFKASWYLKRHPTVAASGQDPLAHALRWAPEEIAPGFDPGLYRLQTGLGDKTSAECLAHYLASRSTRLMRSIADADQERLDQAMGTGLSLAPQTIAVGMVLYNEDPDQLAQSLRSIRAALQGCGPTVSGRIYLFDNGEAPSPVVPSDDLTYVRSAENVGFGAGHNALSRRAFEDAAEVYVGINSDGLLHRDALAAMLRMHTAQAGRALIEALQFPEEHPKFYNPESLETPWISCACYLIPRSIHEVVGGFDPNIFLYCEDVDLSWSARRAGFRTMMCPAALFFHDVSDRGHEPWRFQEMLVSGRYLGHKWGGADFRAWTEDLLVTNGFARHRDELPPLDDLEPLPDRTSVADFDHGFSFAPVRW